MNNDNQAVGMWAENLLFFDLMHPVEILAYMLIDESDEKRSQRENALDPSHQMVGMSFGGHVFKKY